MSVLDPLVIDRYVLYLDNLVMIRIDTDDPAYYQCMFSNNSYLKIQRQQHGFLHMNLPPSFLPFDQGWINDNYIYYMNKTWEGDIGPVLITKLRGLPDIKEYGTDAELDALIASRISLSIAEIINGAQTTSAISDAISSNTEQVVTPLVNQVVTQQITEQVTPVIQQQITEQVTPVVQTTVNTAIAEQINISGLDDYFNNALNSEED